MAAKSWGCRIGLYTCANMGRIILISGVNGEAVENYPAKSLGRPESIPAPPFWLDLLSPSEHLLCRISNGLKLHPRVQRACLSRHREPSCEDFNDYLFIQTSLLEPSRTNLFIKRDIKIILSREYLITVHKSRTSLPRLLPGSKASGFARTGTLFLTLLDSSIDRIVESFCSEEQLLLPLSTAHPSQKNTLWWRLRNFRAALFRDVNFLQEIAIAGDRFFCPDDKSLFDSIRAQTRLLSDVATRLLSRTCFPIEVSSMQTHERIS
jgi:hypothetical protein